MNKYILILLFTCNLFSQNELLSLKSEDFKFKGNVKQVMITDNSNASILYRYDTFGNLIERKQTSGKNEDKIVNAFENGLIIKSETFENSILKSYENFSYSNKKLIKYQLFINGEIITQKEYSYHDNEISKISIKSREGNYIENFTTELNKSIKTISLNNEIFEKKVTEIRDSIKIVSKYEYDLNNPIEVDKYLYNSNNKIISHENYLYGELINKVENFYNQDSLIKQIFTSKDQISLIIEFDKYENWIKKQNKETNSIEKRIIKYDAYLNIEKIQHYKDDSIINEIKYKIEYR